MMGDVAVRFYTIEHFPVREYLGAVTFWARDADLATAEDQAFAGLAERAAAMGADTVVGLRVATERELTIQSEPKALGAMVLVSSDALYRVYVSGTAARV
jgi:uncharacterized protein YbjQ (UPF0145 family)